MEGFKIGELYWFYDEAPYTLRGRPIHFGSCNEEECLFIIKSLEEWNE